MVATANRRRWWHMFPSDQLAEQQFTTPALDSDQKVISDTVGTGGLTTPGTSSALASAAGGSLAISSNALAGRTAVTAADLFVVDQSSMTVGLRSHATLSAAALAIAGVPGSTQASATDRAHRRKPSINTLFGGLGSRSTTSSSAPITQNSASGRQEDADKAATASAQKVPADDDAEEEQLDSILQSFVPNWKSLCEPAVLPLTTDYFPTPTELASGFAQTQYSVLLPRRLPKDLMPFNIESSGALPGSEDSSPAGDAADEASTSASGTATPATDTVVTTSTVVSSVSSLHDAIVEEMVAQRLVQDYQLVVADQLLDEDDVSGGAAAASPSGAYGMGDSRAGPNAPRRVFYLSMGHRIHKIIHDRVNARVEVRMYNRRAAANMPGATAAATPVAASIPGSLLPFSGAAQRVVHMGLPRGLAAPSPCDNVSAGQSHAVAAFLTAAHRHHPASPLGVIAAWPPTAPVPVMPPAQSSDSQLASKTGSERSGLQALDDEQRAARLLALLARALVPGFVDASGTFNYRYMVWCPFRGEPVSDGRAFRLPAAVALRSEVSSAVAMVDAAERAMMGSIVQEAHGTPSMATGQSLPPAHARGPSIATSATVRAHGVATNGRFASGRIGDPTRRTPTFMPTPAPGFSDDAATFQLGSSMPSGSMSSFERGGEVGLDTTGNPSRTTLPSSLSDGGWMERAQSSVGSLSSQPLLGAPARRTIGTDRPASSLSLATSASVALLPRAPAAYPPLPALPVTAAEDYSWNSLDCLLTGEEEDLKHGMRYKRLNLLLVPAAPPAASATKPAPVVGATSGVGASKPSADAGLPAAGAPSNAFAKGILARCVAFEKFWSHLHVRLPAPPASAGVAATSKPERRRAHTYVPVRVFVPLAGFDGAAAASTPTNAAVSTSSDALPATTRTSSMAEPHGAASTVASPPAPIGPADGQGTESRAIKFLASAGGVLRLLRTIPFDDSYISHSVRVDLRTRGPAPFEWVHVNYGGVYNPLRAFPISIRWVIASSIAVESLLTALQRRARQTGFVLVCVPEYSRLALPAATLKSAEASSTLALSSKAPGTMLDVIEQRLRAISRQRMLGVPSEARLLPSFTVTVPLPASAAIVKELTRAASTQFNAPHSPPTDGLFALPPPSAQAPASPARALLRIRPYADRDVAEGVRSVDSRTMHSSAASSPIFAAIDTASVGPSTPAMGSPMLSAANSRGGPQALLIGLRTEDLPLLSRFEQALVSRFGFLPDVAYGGKDASHDTLATWNASRVASKAQTAGSDLLPSFLHDSDASQRDRTISAVSVASSVALATATSQVVSLVPGQHLSSSASLLHPSAFSAGWYRQYVHSSAAAFVRIHAGGVHWIPNALPLSRSQQAAASFLAPWVASAKSSMLVDGSRLASNFSELDDFSAGKLELYRSLTEYCADLR